MINTWKTESYSAKVLGEKIESKVISVPAFQRGVVWNESQQKSLIDSIKRGYPFGTILLYRDSNSKDKIIDGLQRCSTIYKFLTNPAKFFNEEDLTTELIDELALLEGSNGNVDKKKDKIKKVFTDWVRNNHTKMDDVVKMQYSKFAKTLSDEFPLLKPKVFEIIELVTPTLDRYREICSTLSSVLVPTIIIEGDDSHLPDIFERINSQGTSLTKHQIYAATWTTDSIKVSDSLKFILENNRNRYDELNEGNFEIENYDSTDYIANMTVNTFELVFGFGKHISQKYSNLFQFEKSCRKVESIGFNLINACLCGKNNDIKTLNTRLRTILVSDEKINKFLIELLSCIEKVDRKLKPITHFKGNKRDNEGSLLHTELQICSIISSYFINKNVEFDLDKNEKPTNIRISIGKNRQEWSNYQTNFKNNVMKHYVIDILNSKWKGSGDSKLDALIANREGYTRKVEWKEFESVASSWFIQLNQERNELKKISTVKDQEMAILALVYLNVFSAIEAADDKNYDIEHLATKKLMKDSLEKYNGELKLPISSIGNLCLLPEYINRSKKDKTIYDDKVYLGSISLDYVEEKYTFTKKTDLDWVHKDLNINDFRVEYFRFIEKRFASMMKIIEDNYGMM